MYNINSNAKEEKENLSSQVQSTSLSNEENIFELDNQNDDHEVLLLPINDINEQSQLSIQMKNKHFSINFPELEDSVRVMNNTLDIIKKISAANDMKLDSSINQVFCQYKNLCYKIDDKATLGISQEIYRENTFTKNNILDNRGGISEIPRMKSKKEYSIIELMNSYDQQYFHKSTSEEITTISDNISLKSFDNIEIENYLKSFEVENITEIVPEVFEKQSKISLTTSELQYIIEMNLQDYALSIEDHQDILPTYPEITPTFEYSLMKPIETKILNLRDKMYSDADYSFQTESLNSIDSAKIENYFQSFLTENDEQIVEDTFEKHSKLSLTTSELQYIIEMNLKDDDVTFEESQDFIQVFPEIVPINENYWTKNNYNVKRTFRKNVYSEPVTELSVDSLKVKYLNFIDEMNRISDFKFESIIYNLINNMCYQVLDSVTFPYSFIRSILLYKIKLKNNFSKCFKFYSPDNGPYRRNKCLSILSQPSQIRSVGIYSRNESLVKYNLMKRNRNKKSVNTI